ncbi:PEGA domain-containing protein [Lujinxingia litoralis]|nr:PEGA domain-containing protein [Lujinxingia litoralis]
MLAMLLALCLWSPTARAQTPPQECPDYLTPDLRHDPRSLTMVGVACFEAGHYEAALRYYLQAYKLAPDPLLRGAIGRSLHELGVWGPARHFYLGYLATPDADSPSAERIRERVAQLESALRDDAATLEVRSEPAGATAHLELEHGAWVDLGPTPVNTRVRPGRYQVVLTHPGYKTRREKVSVGAGRNARLEETLVSEAAAFDVSAASWRRGGTWTMAASAPVAVAGTAMLILASQNAAAARDAEYQIEDSDALERRQTELLARGDRYRAWGTTGAAVGAAGVLTGLVLYLSANRLANPGRGAEDTAATLLPELGPNYAGLRIAF